MYRTLFPLLFLAACGGTNGVDDRAEQPLSPVAHTVLDVEIDARPALETHRVDIDVDGLCPRDGALEMGPNGSFRALVTPGADRIRSACNRETWENGRDAVLTFVAPTDGSWLFWARGQQLWTFGASRGYCAEEPLACDRFTQYHGGDPFGLAQGFTLDLAAGELVYLVMDGCPRGADCRWDVRAIAALPLGADCSGVTPDWRRADEPVLDCDGGTFCEAGTCVEATPPTLTGAVATRLGDELRVRAWGTDDTHDAAQLQIELLDARGGTLSGPADRWTREVVVEDDDYTVWMFGQWAEAAAAAQVRLAVVDGQGLVSNSVVIDVHDLPVHPVGGACDGYGVDSICDADGICHEGRCTRARAPTIDRFEAFVNPELGTVGWVAAGADANGDALGYELTLLDSRGDTVQSWRGGLSNPDEPGDRFSARGARFTAGLGVVAQVGFAVFDAHGLFSQPVIVDASDPLVVGAGDACDPLGAFTVCTERFVCTGGQSPQCQTPVEQCVDVVPEVLEGPVRGQFGEVDHGAGSCGGAGGADSVYRLHLTPGRYEVSAIAQMEPPPVLYARTLCSQDGRWSELACNSRTDYHSAATWLDLDIDTEGDVYIYVDAWSADQEGSFVLDYRRVEEAP